VSTKAKAEATIEDLYHVPENGKAELVDGELVLMPPTGDLPGTASGNIFASLREYARRTKTGRAYGDNVGFLVTLPRRKSFSPDAAFHTGPRSGMRFLTGAPVFAVEVRSEGDYGPSADKAMKRKRDDYFAAGSLVVWDVDPLGAEVVRSYRSGEPDAPRVFRRGDTADAEPAVPSWRLVVDDLFD
jgi:Uma2 family endonuclease